MNRKQKFIFQENIFNKEAMTSVCSELGRVRHYLTAFSQYVVMKMQLYVIVKSNCRRLHIPSLHYI
jgi:hypothetical protein